MLVEIARGSVALLAAMDLSAIRDQLAGHSDPLLILGSLFASSPFPAQVFAASGRSVLVNDAFRALFGAEPADDYSVLEDAIVERAGILGYIRQAFAGEATRVPAVWYDLGAPTHPGEDGAVRRVGVESQLIPLHDESRALAYVLAFFSDRTEGA
ncbi:hypothetical protein BH11MYX4_BH11MYX4_18540 [soil metagenome]